MPGKKGGNGLFCLALIGGIVLANYALPGANLDGKPGADPQWGTLIAWLLTMIAMVMMLRAIGIALQDRPAGVLIDNRNRISLSKLQMIGWTVLILAALVTMAATRLAGLAFAPASLAIPTTLLVLMGISATSLVAAPSLLSLKPATVDARSDADKARWTDLVQGDEESNRSAPDLSKIQQVLITLIVMTVFLFMMGNAFVNASPTAKLGYPELGEDLIWLIGISHAGYLAYKAAPHSSTPANQAASTTTTTATDEEGAIG